MYANIIEPLKKVILSKEFLTTHRNSPKAFTRQRKLPFHLLICFLLNFVKGSYQDELDKYNRLIEFANINHAICDVLLGKISIQNAVDKANEIAAKDVDDTRKIGEFGNELIKDGFSIQTHCNAGWLAFVDYGTALSPIYYAKNAGKKIFVYVDETRPRSQGARLTAWELKNENIPHVIVPDNAGAYLMSKGKVDLMIVGADRIAANGDVANKIGTFEKAVIAKEFGVPFYVAAPTSTFDDKCNSGNEIIIENRNQDEVLFQTGLNVKGELEKVLVCSPGSNALNPAFDVTPAKYISGIITEKGIIKAEKESIALLLKS